MSFFVVVVVVVFFVVVFGLLVIVKLLQTANCMINYLFRTFNYS